MLGFDFQYKNQKILKLKKVVSYYYTHLRVEHKWAYSNNLFMILFLILQNDAKKMLEIIIQLF